MAICVIAVGIVCPQLPALGTPNDPGDTRPDAWAVLPPGNGYPFGPTARHTDDQRLMYDSIDDAAARGTLAGADTLDRWYRPLTLDAPASERVMRTETPRPDLNILWDTFGVPYVEGESSEAVAFGAGWVMAEARGLVADIARKVGRSGAQELGTDDLFAALDADVRADWTDAELTVGLDRLVEVAPEEGGAVLAELDAYVAGFNAWVTANPLPHKLLRLVFGLENRPWNRADVVASLLTVVDGNASGGGEIENSRIRAALHGRFGVDAGQAVYDELRAADEPTTTHVGGKWDYPVFAAGHTGTDAASEAVPDQGTLSKLAPPVQQPGHSNAVVVTAAKSADSHPILVGGPQNALTSPALLLEVHLSGGGYATRGVLMPGIGPYVIVGRSRASAWTSTSGESDQTDTRAELLCEPDGSTPTPESRHYVFAGECVPMSRPPGARTGTVWRTRHGPVITFGTVAGVPVGLTLERASRGHEVLAALALRRLNFDQVGSPEEFLDATRHITFTGHWFWVDNDDAVYAHVGRFPIRAAGASTEMPVWGTGEWEWQGTVDPAQQPHAVNPPDGILHSWNNKTARGWRTADDDWGNVGPHRVDLLAEPVAAGDAFTLAEVVDIHTTAGATDLRGAGVLPEVLAVLDSGPAPNGRLDAARDALRDWMARGATRRDSDHDWFYDHAGVPLIDALFPRAVHAAFADLDGLWDVLRPPVDAGARNAGSSFGYGWYGLLWRDLRRVRGAEPGVAHCGAGSLTACRDALWAALDAARAEVARRQLPWNRAGVANWTAWTVPERIFFLPYIFNPSSIRWSNRPAYEIAVSFN